MKSKLFLSLSLLTAVFSQAGSLAHVNQTSVYLQKVKANAIKSAELLKKLNFKANATAGLKGLGLVAIPAAGTIGAISYAKSTDQTELTKQTELAKQAELANRSYFQVAKDSMKSGYNTVAATASDIYKNATYENMKNASVDGFNATTTFVKNKPYQTAGGVAAVAALTYGAYKLYNSDMFAKGSNPVVTPVKKQERKSKINFSNNVAV